MATEVDLVVREQTVTLAIAQRAAADVTITGGSNLGAVLAELIKTTGTTRVGYGSRTLDAKLKDHISVKDYGTLGTGVAADAAFAAARTAANTLGIKRIIVPAGHYLLTNFAASLAGVVWEGDGESTRLTVGANASNVIAVTGERNTFRGMKLEGDGTGSSTAAGNGIRLTAGGLVVEDVWFTGFGHGGIAGNASTALDGPHISRTRHRLTGTGGHDIYLDGAWRHILIEEPDMVTSAALRGILIANDGANYWTHVQVKGGWVEGYASHGVAVSDEDWDGTNRVFGFEIEGTYFKNTAESAVKAKLSKGVRVYKVIAESCGGDPEDALSGLYGTILLNSIGQMVVTGCVLRDNGDAGIKFSGNDGPPKSRPGDAFGLASIVCSDNIIEGCGLDVANGGDAYGSGIVATGRMRSLALHHNHVRGVTRYGYLADGVAPNAIQALVSTGNQAGNSPTNTYYAFYYKNALDVKVLGDEATGFGGLHAVFEDVKTVAVDPTTRYHDGEGTGALVLFTDCENIYFSGKANCSLYSTIGDATAYVVGDRAVNNNNVYECTTAGTTGTGTHPTGSSLTTEYTDGTVKWHFVHGHRKNTAGVQFSGTAPLVCHIGDGANFDYITGTDFSNPPSTLRRSRIWSGEGTLAAGAATVNLPRTEADATYLVLLTPRGDETLRVSARTTTTFTVTSSVGASTNNFFWQAFR